MAAAPHRSSAGRRAKKDLELEAGSFAHYEDPSYYTSTYRRRIDDVQMYVGLAVKNGSEVLEYGVGNGRVLKDGSVVKPELKVGDRVLYSKYAGNEIKINGVDHLIMREDDILAVVQ